MAEVGIDRVRTRAIAERAGVNPALVHYHFGSMSALVMEAAQDALLRELGPSVELLRSGATIGDSIRASWSGSSATGSAPPARRSSPRPS
jgi:AcrR family transcriptional regulator